MSGVKGTVKITGNVFDGAHDDAINIHGTYLEVTGRPTPNTLTLEYRHNETAGFPQYHPGDEVEIVDKRTMVAVPGVTAKVVSVDGPSGQDHDKSLTSMTVTFDQPLPDSVRPWDFVVENTTYTPTVQISGNTFRDIPTRGVLVTTRKPVVIENNVFDGMSMASIFISSDAYQWYESGPVRDVLIRGNTFLRPASPVIFVEPTNQVLDPAQPVHRNIRVESNTFKTGDVRLLDAKSVGGITFNSNTVSRLDRNTAFTAQAKNRCPARNSTTSVRTVTTASPYSTSLFSYHGSSGAVIHGNAFDNGLNLRADLDATDPGQVTSDEVVNGGDRVLPLLPTVSYTTSNGTVAKVDSTGKVTARSAGDGRHHARHPQPTRGHHRRAGHADGRRGPGLARLHQAAHPEHRRLVRGPRPAGPPRRPARRHPAAHPHRQRIPVVAPTAPAISCSPAPGTGPVPRRSG